VGCGVKIFNTGAAEKKRRRKKKTPGEKAGGGGLTLQKIRFLKEKAGEAGVSEHVGKGGTSASGATDMRNRGG